MIFPKTQINSEPILKDVSLCAIVRDEKMNPAGGIERFLESHVPYVDEAVIVDTGSVDGTREILENLSSKYRNMKVYDLKFKGFANARNYSLSKANCRWILCLDADELLAHKKPKNYMKRLNNYIKESDGAKNFSVDFNHILPDGTKGNSPAWPERIFLNGSQRFYREVWEEHTGDFGKNIDVTILHFLPSYSGIMAKQGGFYNHIWKNLKTGIPPSQTERFDEWKEYNPQRSRYE